MNILLIAKLANHTLNENILAPLLKSSRVNRIYVLRDYVGDTISDRVTYLCLDKRTGKMRHVKKVIHGVMDCSKLQIDVIVGVLNTPHGYIGQMISLFTRIPYIHVTIAGHREFWIDGKILEKINLAVFKRSAFVTVTGEQTKRYLISKEFQANRIVILPNLPNATYSNVPVCREDREYDIVSFSRIDKNKNISLAIRAIAKLQKEYQVRMIIAGDGEELQNLKKDVSAYGLNHVVDFVGYISEIQDKIRIYSNSKIFISCSKGEGFPVSLLEAMSCGCVPVVSNVGDIVDVIEQGENGYVYSDTDDETELANYLASLLNDDKQLRRMSEKAIKIRDMISAENNAKIWDNILSGIK